MAKLLNELPAEQREDAVNSLAYEAEARLRDPISGCVGLISILLQRLKQVQGDLFSAKKELAGYIGPSTLLPMIQPPFANAKASIMPIMKQHPYNMMAIPTRKASEA
ncbi:LOB domain-containing protein 36 [Bienertia sinuspersici]